MALSDAQIDSLHALLDGALEGRGSLVLGNKSSIGSDDWESAGESATLATNNTSSSGAQESYEVAAINIFRFIMRDEAFSILEKALAIVDSKGERAGKPIVCYETHAQPSEPFPRRVWRVPGVDRDSYLCYRNYCSCRSFFEKARASRSRVLCKHLVAVILASALKRVTVVVVSEAEVAVMVAGSLDNKRVIHAST